MMADGKRTAHSLTQVFGLVLISVALLIVTIMILVLVDGEGAEFFGPVAAIAVAGSFVVWRFDKVWARIVGIVVTLGAIATTFFLAFGLVQPFSPIEFLLGLIFVLGVLLSLIGGIRALISGRKGDVGPTSGEARLRTVTLGLIGVAAVISIAGFLLTKTSVSDTEAAGAVPLNMVNFEFDRWTRQ